VNPTFALKGANKMILHKDYLILAVLEAAAVLGSFFYLSPSS
jgi:hypothetical protein